MKTGKYIGLLASAVILLSGCMDDDDWYRLNKDQNPAFRGDSLQRGVFIVNEGNFTYDNASLSWYDIDSMKVENDVFYRTNQVPLGDVANSMTAYDSLGYIVVNNSSKIYVINLRTFEYVGKITGLTSPRYIHFVNEKRAYVSDLYARAITVVNPKTLEITGHIDTRNNASELYQHSTEQFVQYDRYVITNCWSYDDKVLVIDSEYDWWIDSLNVGLQPNSIVLDRFDRLWVLSDGGYEGNPAGYEKPLLSGIDLFHVIAFRNISMDLEDHPHSLEINGTGDTLYFINDHVYRMSIFSREEPELFIRSRNPGGLLQGYYSLGIDPYSGEVYVADAGNQANPGMVYRYKPNGTLVDSFAVGIGPGEFCFVGKPY